MSEAKRSEFPPRIHTVENGTKLNEGVFISWEEHEQLLRAAKAEAFEEAAKIVDKRESPGVTAMNIRKLASEVKEGG